MLFLACIAVKNRLPVPLPLERGIESPIWPVDPLGHSGPDRCGFELVKLVIERRSARQGRSKAERELGGCAGAGSYFLLYKSFR